MIHCLARNVRQQLRMDKSIGYGYNKVMDWNAQISIDQVWTWNLHPAVAYRYLFLLSNLHRPRLCCARLNTTWNVGLIRDRFAFKELGFDIAMTSRTLVLSRSIKHAVRNVKEPRNIGYPKDLLFEIWKHAQSAVDEPIHCIKLSRTWLCRCRQLACRRAFALFIVIERANWIRMRVTPFQFAFRRFKLEKLSSKQITALDSFPIIMPFCTRQIHTIYEKKQQFHYYCLHFKLSH